MVPTQDELRAFIAAAGAGYVDAVRAMAEGSPELVDAPLPTGERAIHAASYAGKSAVCDWLYAHGVQRDIFLRISLGEEAEVRAMLEAEPALARVETPTGASPLHRAVFWGYPAIASMLLDWGADVNAANGPSRLAPLNSAVAAPTPYCPGDQEDVVLETVNVLLAHGADVRHRTVIGLSAMFEAAANGDLRVVQRLVEAGADPHLAAIEYDGPYSKQRPIDFAAARGQAHVVAWLSALPAPA